MLPITLFLFYKTAMGIRWVIRRFKRPHMQTYYHVSWAFYSAYAAQASFALLYTWHVFNDEFRVLTTISICLCVPLWLILALYMSFLDKQ